MENWTGIIVAFITGVLGPLSIIFVKNWLSKNKKKPDMVQETLKVSELVNQKIENIKEEFKPDRVWITQFHNGGNFYPTGKSMAKFSIIYETVNPGVNSVQSNFHNIPVNLFSKSINELLNNDLIAIQDYKDETIATFGLKYIAEDTNCKSGYLFDYTKKKVKLDPDDIIALEIHATALGGVLMTHLSQ
jgi:hypothetical protein